MEPVVVQWRSNLFDLTMSNRNEDKTEPIAVALSGGVDSATVAAMLVAEGRQVIGLTMRLYDASGTTASIGGRCCGPKDMEDARRVCQKLDIPFYVVDFAEEFRSHVMDYFSLAYLTGKTPNPCAKCNEHIKFTPLLQRARALGASTLATGHYARIDQVGDSYRLRRGLDASKDQSYFLFAMPRDELAAVVFPLGGLTKQEVRRKAGAFSLPVATKPESQEICFVPDGQYANFVEKDALRRRLKAPSPGAFVDLQGNEIGKHKGVHHYTVGQRRGLGNLRNDGQPGYVTRIDADTNQVVIGTRQQAARDRLEVEAVRWFGVAPGGTARLQVQIRHRSAAVAAEVVCKGAEATVIFLDGPMVAAAGQAAVFYSEDTVLGGGWIA